MDICRNFEIALSGCPDFLHFAFADLYTHPNRSFHWLEIRSFVTLLLVGDSGNFNWESYLRITKTRMVSLDSFYKVWIILSVLFKPSHDGDLNINQCQGRCSGYWSISEGTIRIEDIQCDRKTLLLILLKHERIGGTFFAVTLYITFFTKGNTSHTDSSHLPPQIPITLLHT